MLYMTILFNSLNWNKLLPHLYQPSLTITFTLINKKIGTDFFQYITMQFFLGYINNFLHYHIKLHLYQCRYKN